MQAKEVKIKFFGDENEAKLLDFGRTEKCGWILILGCYK
jgi:hypothetical protein